jgi:hypothetical protein
VAQAEARTLAQVVGVAVGQLRQTLERRKPQTRA